MRTHPVDKLLEQHWQYDHSPGQFNQDSRNFTRNIKLSQTGLRSGHYLWRGGGGGGGGGTEEKRAG